ncbi:sorting nexin-2-like, partial [Sinocyclocheilus rhinocerous]|uniref:sorting nexin-2-like n=1 Tax=Sinocyclocheilus rhinocerous TaxID=307959 RepID=UPI0007B903C0
VLSGSAQTEGEEDLFVSAMESPEAARLSAEDISPGSNGPKAEPMLLDDDPDDLFAEATEEVSLDSPERHPILSDGPSPVITPVTPVMISSRADVFDRSPDQDEDEEENRDTFDIQISVSDPEKVGDGMNAYMVYKVLTKTSLSIFSRDEVCVKRRFSDFLGLHSKLASKYMHMGYIVPPAPEKSIVGMTKVKVGKEDLSSVEFVEKRRSALERYLLRTVKHPALLKDTDVLQFLESSEVPLPFLIKWFEEKQQQFDNLDVQLRKLHASVESLVFHRKELSVNTASFAKSAAMLGNSEDHVTLQEFMTVIDSFKHETFPAFLISAFSPSRPTKEIEEWEGKVQQGERDFEQISKNIRREVGRFEKDRVKDFRVVIIKYLESLVHTQQQLIKYWEAFLPEAKAIA